MTQRSLTEHARAGGPNTHAPDVLKLVCQLVSPHSKILDVGCGDGALMQMLMEAGTVRAQGLEISRRGVASCVARGLAVVQGDANTDLADYPDKSFDYVILTQTIQAMMAPLEVLNQSMRIADRVIVSMPNFAHWRLRVALLTRGRMPRSDSLPAEWYETDNIHLCTIRDFIDLCAGHHFVIDGAYAGQFGQKFRAFSLGAMEIARVNLMAQEALFVLRKAV